MAAELPKWKIRIVPLVIGAYGNVHKFVKELKDLKLWKEKDIVQIGRDAQFAAVSSLVRILRRHLATQNL